MDIRKLNEILDKFLEAGYDWNNGMSNNAVDAYEKGEKPLSKWKSKDIIDAIESMKITDYEQKQFGLNENVKQRLIEFLKHLSQKDLKKILTRSSYHHTGKFYNATDFYKIPDSISDIISDLEYLGLIPDFDFFLE